METVMKTQMNVLPNSPLQVMTPDRVLRAFLAAWRRGNVVEAADLFDDRFVFIDHALGLEFTDKQRLVEFVKKKYEYFPDTARADQTILQSEDCIISEWTLTATLAEPYFGERMRQVPIRVQGISVVRIKNGKIIRWSDYYDQLTSRRHQLAAWFTEWVEL
jgi:steroid delta-isomerase-like uncharacterized protein